MARAPVAAIEASGVTGEPRPHGSGKRPGTSPEQEMGVIREQGPGIDGEPTLLRQGGEPRDEVGAVRIAAEDYLAVEAPHHHMVEDSGGIEARAAWHSDEKVT